MPTKGEAPCPNCDAQVALIGDACSACGFTGRCHVCGEDTALSADPWYCSEQCYREARGGYEDVL